MLEQGAHTGTPGASVARTDVGRSEASAARGTVSMTTGGQDAAASNGDEFSQGQPRQSPEFMRFAAALAPARTGDRAAVTQALSVTPVPGTVATPPAAAVDPVAPLMPPAPADTPDAENVGRLVQAMRVSARAGAWEATVRLKPEHLGEVTIALRVDRNVVSAVVNAEAAGVRQWLQSQEQAVRSGMAEHGLQLERFLVQRDGQRHDAQPQDQQRRRPRPKPQDDAAARFEIVV